MKWKSIAVWAAAIVAVLILVAFAALKIFVSPEAVAMLVIPRIEEIFERDATFKSVDLSFFPHLGVRLQGIEIKNSPEFPEHPLARIDHIDANIGFFSLLGGDPEIDQLVVVGWEMLLETDSLGRRNFVHFVPDTISQSDSTVAREMVSEPLCREFRLSGGRLLYRNDSTNVRLILAGVELSYSLRGEGSEFFEGRLTVDSLMSRNRWADLRLTQGAVEAGFEGTYLVDSDSLAIRKCDWRIDAFKGRLDGRLTGLRALPDYTLHIISERTILAEATESEVLGLIPGFKDLAPSGDLRMELSIADATADTLSPNVRGEINLTDLTFAVPGVAATTQVRFAEANFNHRSLSLYTEGATIGQSPALLRFTIDDFADPTYSGEINLVGDANVILGLLGVESSVQVGGYVEAALSGFIRPADLEAGRLFGSLVLDGLSYHDSLNAVGIDNLTLDSRFVGNAVQLSSFNLALGENSLSLTGDITEFPLAFSQATGSLRRPQLEFNLTSNKFDFDTLATLDAMTIFGESDTSNVWRLVDQILQFNARGTVEIDSGRFMGADFTNLQGDLSVVDRIVYSDSARVDAFGGKLDGEVVMEFSSLYGPDLEIDFRARSIEAAQFLDYYTGLGESISGRSDLTCSLTGHGLGGAGLRNSLAMRGSFSLVNGFVGALPIAENFRSELGIDAFSRGQVSAIAGEFILANQTMRLNRLAFDSGPIEYSVNGKIDLGGEVALDVRRSLTQNDIVTLSRLPDARSLMPRNPREAIFRITGMEGEYRIAIDSFR